MPLTINWDIAKAARPGRGSSQNSGAKLVNYLMKDGRRQACLTIYEDTMKRMRWAIGDRLLFAPGQYNGKPCVGIKRVPSGGRAISPASSAKGYSEKLAGQSVSGACRWATEVFAGYRVASHLNADLEEVDGALILPLEHQGEQ